MYIDIYDHRHRVKVDDDGNPVGTEKIEKRDIKLYARGPDFRVEGFYGESISVYGLRDVVVRPDQSLNHIQAIVWPIVYREEYPEKHPQAGEISENEIGLAVTVPIDDRRRFHKIQVIQHKDTGAIALVVRENYSWIDKGKEDRADMGTWKGAKVLWEYEPEL